jgi:hypothetical protein
MTAGRRLGFSQTLRRGFINARIPDFQALPEMGGIKKTPHYMCETMEYDVIIFILTLD